VSAPFILPPFLFPGAPRHYSGRAPGPVAPFGFDMGAFAVESECLLFRDGAMMAARTQVVPPCFHPKDPQLQPSPSYGR